MFINFYLWIACIVFSFSCFQRFPSVAALVLCIYEKTENYVFFHIMFKYLRVSAVAAWIDLETSLVFKHVLKMLFLYKI